MADVRPLVAVTGPDLAPALTVAVVVTHGKRRTDERKVVEPVEEEAVTEKAVIPIEAAKSTFEAVLPAVEIEAAIEATRCHAPASKPGAETAAMEPTKTAATETAATEPPMEAAATEPTMGATTTEPTTATRHGWRWKGDCCAEHDRGKATEEFAFHDSDPSSAIA